MTRCNNCGGPVWRGEPCLRCLGDSDGGASKEIERLTARTAELEEALAALCSGIGAELWERARALLAENSIERRRDKAIRRAEAIVENFREMHPSGPKGNAQ